MSEITITLPQLTNKQNDIFFSNKRNVLCIASSKAGKTMSSMVWLFSHAISGKQGHMYTWAAPTYAQSYMVFQRFKKIINSSELKDWVTFNEAKLTITLPNGSFIKFFSCDNVEGLYGYTSHAAVIDEVTRCKQEAYLAVRSTLTPTEGPIRMIGNAKSRSNWAMKLYTEMKTDPSWLCEKLTILDSVNDGIITKEEYDELKRTTTPEQFSCLYLAEPLSTEGEVYKDVHKNIREISSKPPIVIGIDIASRQDYTSIIGLDEGGVVCYEENFQTNWAITKNKIINVCNKYKVKTYIDTTGHNSVIEDIAQETDWLVPYTFSNNSKKELVLNSQSMLSQFKCFITKGELFDQLSNYEYWITPNGTVKYGCIAGHDDLATAYMLAVYGFNQQNKKLLYSTGPVQSQPKEIKINRDRMMNSSWS